MVDSVGHTLPTGVVLAATGQRYHSLSKGAARSLREHHPDLPIDLFTDVPDESDDGLFSRVVPIGQVWHRSKIDTMIQTRFDRTLYLDADVLIVAAIDDLFELLEQFDIALAQDQQGNSEHATRVWRQALPACFPQLNSGVVAYRSNPEVLGLLRTWRDVVQSEGHCRDQPALRELLWQSDLRLTVLPPQYNFTEPQELVMFRADQIAPRIIHGLSRGFRDVATADRPRRPILDILKTMAASDRYLAGRESRDVTRTTPIRKRVLQLRAALALARR